MSLRAYAPRGSDAPGAPPPRTEPQGSLGEQGATPQMIADVANDANAAAAKVIAAAAAQAHVNATTHEEVIVDPASPSRRPSRTVSPHMRRSGGGGSMGLGRLGSRIQRSAIGTVKGRLTYAQMRRDMLRGRMSAIDMLRHEEMWPPIEVPSEGCLCNVAWNRGLPSAPSEQGRFCAYCLQRDTPLLARHRYIECGHRQLSGQAEFSLAALERLEKKLEAREATVREHLRNLTSVVVRRKQCKDIFDEVQGVIGYLRVGPPDAPPLPIGPPPKREEPSCVVRPRGFTHCVRHLGSYLARQAADATADLRDLGLNGGMFGGVWGELKTLLVMSPRRALMLGGLEELQEEAEEAAAAAAADPLARAKDNLNSSDESEPESTLTEEEEEGGGEDEDEEAAGLRALDQLVDERDEADAMTSRRRYSQDSLERHFVATSTLTYETHRGGLGRGGGGHGGGGSRASRRVSKDEPHDPMVCVLIAETLASALATAPLRTAAAAPEEHALSADPLADAARHLPAATRGRAAERQAEQREEAAALEAGGGASAADGAAAAERKPRRGSLTKSLWVAPDSRHALLDPEAVRREAERLGVDLTLSDEPGVGDFHLLPLVVESLRAPLPGGWHDVLRDGEIMYVHDMNLTAPPQAEHPLTAAFREVIQIERRRLKRMHAPPTPFLPPWLVEHAKRWMQFVDGKGDTYFYDFGTGETVGDITILLAKYAPANATRGPRPPPYPRTTVFGMPFDAAGRGPAPPAAAAEAGSLAAVVEAGGGGGGASAADELSFSKCTSEPSFAPSEPPISPEQAAADEHAASLRKTFHQMLSTSLATSPRPLTTTLEVAKSYGISVDHEPHYLWLADLALALPLPAGWVQVEHPKEEQRHFWFNELAGSSQWRHPVDDFIHQTLKMQRAPSSPHVQLMRRSRVPPRRK